MTTTTYAVQGMTCDHCVAAVTQAVSGLDGVTSAAVDLGAGTVQVTSDAVLDRSVLAAAVDEAGYALGRSNADLLEKSVTSRCVTDIS